LFLLRASPQVSPQASQRVAEPLSAFEPLAEVHVETFV
jgi:hypothetical protein